MIENEKKSVFSKTIVLVLVALFCCALWGSATPAIKTGYKLLEVEGVASIMLFAGMRFTLAGIFTVIIFSIARRKLLYPKLENVPRVLTVSAFQTVIQYIFFYLGLAYTTGVKGTIASGSSAFFCVIISSLIFRQEKLTAKKIIACILGICGIVIINLQGLELTMNFLGDGFVIFSTIAYSFSSVFMKRFSKHEDPVVLSGYQFIFGGAFMIILGLVLGGKVSFESTKGVIILVYLAFLSAIAYAVWGMLLKYNPVSKVTIFSFTTPIFGTILSLLLLPEASQVNTINLIITLILVSGGIFLLNYQKSRAPKVEDEITISEK